jgi:hypothetical protein
VSIRGWLRVLARLQAASVLATLAAGSIKKDGHKPQFTGLATVIGYLLVFQTMPIRYREVLEYMHGYFAAYPLGFEADETRHQYIVADRNGYRLGESSALKRIEEIVKAENEVFSNSMQRKTFGQLIATFARLPSPDESGKQSAIVSDQTGA